MGSGHSSAKPAEAQDADTGTQLFGSWDKPVAEAYALKKQASKKGKAAASTAADAANAALGSAIDLEAGAGVKPAGRKTPGKQKGAGVPTAAKSKSGGEAWALHQSSKDPARVTAAKQALTGKLSKSVPKKPVQAQPPPKVQANADKKRSAEAWTLSQSSKNPAKVAAARKGLEAKFDKPSKFSQGPSIKKAGTVRSPQLKASGGKGRSSLPGPAMLHGKHPAFSKAKLGVKEKSGVVKKSSKAAAGTASKVAGKAAEAVQTVATASQGVMQGAATAAQGAATAAKTAATQAVKSAQKAVNNSGVMDSSAVAEATHLTSKASEAVKEASHTVQGAMSMAVMQAGASAEKGIKNVAAETPMAAQKAKATAAVAKTEIKKSAAKVANKTPKAKKALKRMVSEIDAGDAKTEGLGRGKRQRKQVKVFEPTM